MLSSRLSVKSIIYKSRGVVNMVSVRYAATDEHSERKPSKDVDVTPELKKHLRKMGITNPNIV